LGPDKKGLLIFMVSDCAHAKEKVRHH
jgi:hypothetical protein